jgi:hypothetical protein
MPNTSPRALALALLAGASALAVSAPALAAEDPALARIEAELAAQSARIAAQDRKLAEQAQLIETQSLELRALRAQRDDILDEIRAGRRVAPPPVQIADQQVRPAAPGPEVQPVGEAPTVQPVEVAAVPEGMGVLTPKGGLIFDPSFEFVRSSNNRLVFRGVEIVPGINFGLIEADDADRDTLVGTLAARYGLTDRLEVEARVPYVYRHDRITTVRAAEPRPVELTDNLEGQDLGDVEVSARYQLNRGLDGWPIFVANARVKTPSGQGPYDVRYDGSVAQELATGSGFWSAEAGITMLYPTDPAVIFGGLTYARSFAADIDKTFGETRVLRVDPGDSIGANLGFGLALNPRFSVSLGYSHTYIFRSESEQMSLDATEPVILRANSLQVGSLQMGWSFRLNDHVTLNNNFEFGVTSDAPDMRVVFRAPYRF